MDLSYHSRKKFANTLAKNAGLTLVEEDVSMPRTDGKTIYTPRYSQYWECGDDDYTKWWYVFLHEIYHNKFPEDFSIIRENNINMRSPFGMILNVIVDHNIEYSSKGYYPGLDAITSKGFALLYDESMEKVKKIEERNPKLDAVFKFDGIVRSGWNSYVNIDEEDISGECYEWLDKLQPFAHDWERKKSAEENYDLAKRIADALDIPNECSQQNEDGESNKNGRAGEEKDGKEGEAQAEGGIVDYMELLNHTHEPDGTASTPNNVTIDYSKWNHYDGWEPGELVAESPVGTKDEWVREGVLRLHGGEYLADEMREYLQVMTQSRMEVGHRNGRVHGGSLWRTRAYGTYTEAGSSVFKQSVYDEELDTSILILVDGSGSMYGNKYCHAVKSALLLNETFTELDVPVAIQSFTDSRKNHHLLHKEFDDEISQESLLETFQRAASMMANNADGDNIQYAADQLLQRREQKKILIVLSDGQPAGSSGAGDIYGWTKEVVQRIEEDGDIEIYGIGLMDSTVEDIYSNSKVIRDPKDIEPTLITLLKDHVLV